MRVYFTVMLYHGYCEWFNTCNSGIVSKLTKKENKLLMVFLLWGEVSPGVVFSVNHT